MDGVSIPPVFVAVHKGHRRIVKRLVRARASKTMPLPDSMDQMASLEEAFPIPTAIK